MERALDDRKRVSERASERGRERTYDRAPSRDAASGSRDYLPTPSHSLIPAA